MKKLIIFIIILVSVNLYAVCLDGYCEGQVALNSGFFNPQSGEYHGEWKNGKPDGRGTFISDDKNYKYTGFWKNGKCFGQGVYLQTNGFKYEGNFNEYGAPDGYGIMTLPKGQVYTGEIKYDKVSGQSFWEGQGKLCGNGICVQGIWEKNKLIKEVE